MIRSFEELEGLARANSGLRMAVVCPYEEDALTACLEAYHRGFVRPLFYGVEEKIRAKAREIGLDLEDLEIVHVKDNDAVQAAVTDVNKGHCSLLMKGMIKTAALLKGVLNKEWGLRTGRQLSHLGLFKPRCSDHLVGITDSGMNMYPDVMTKATIIQNAVDCLHRLGVENPKVACLAAVEVINPEMKATLDAATLKAMNARGQITGCVVDGPFALDNALSRESAAIKGINSPVAGDADLLLVPDIESGNLTSKVHVFMCGGVFAGVVLGAKAPLVLSSRFDNPASKLAGIVFGLALCNHER